MMLRLFFGDLFSVLTTVVVLAVLTFIVVTFLKRERIVKWGRLLLVFIIVGTAISGLAAIRDAYMMKTALFSVESIQSTICSIAGGLIFLTGFITLFVKKQKFRKMSFYLVSGLFTIQVLTIEVSRVILGGMV